MLRIENQDGGYPKGGQAMTRSEYAAIGQREERLAQLVTASFVAEEVDVFRSARGLTESILEIQLEAWRATTACRDKDPAIFVPGPKYNPAEAKKSCAVCPHCEPCLESAIRNQDIGVRGNTSQRERIRLIRQRNRSTSSKND